VDETSILAKLCAASPRKIDTRVPSGSSRSAPPSTPAARAHDGRPRREWGWAP